MKLEKQKIAVCGVGGFIGGHLVQHLLAQGLEVVRAVDCKPREEWYQHAANVENLSLDLKEKEACEVAVRDVDVVFNLAADMGGMRFIENNKALCMLSVLINTNLLLAGWAAGIQRFFFSSSACVYNGDKQRDAAVIPLKEADAYPALPEDGYGWERDSASQTKAQIQLESSQGSEWPQQRQHENSTVSRLGAFDPAAGGNAQDVRMDRGSNERAGYAEPRPSVLVIRRVTAASWVLARQE